MNVRDALWRDEGRMPEPAVRFRGGPFSNFGVCRIVMAHPYWPSPCEYLTVEHRFQAMKATTDGEHEYVRHSSTAATAKRRGREIVLRDDWEAVKDDVMREALREKFKIAHLREQLLDTGDRELVEDAPWDAYWGNGPDGNGMNMLGKLLMELRAEIRSS